MHLRNTLLSIINELILSIKRNVCKWAGGTDSVKYISSGKLKRLVSLGPIKCITFCVISLFSLHYLIKKFQF